MRQSIRLERHGRELKSIFDLLGEAENDLTAALGWTLANSRRLLREFIRDVLGPPADAAVTGITLQEYSHGRGITDIEIHGPELACIIEAKRGWHLPGASQLERYAARLADRSGRCALVVISEYSSAYAEPRLPQMAPTVALMHRSWGQIESLRESAARQARLLERQLLNELGIYLRRVMSMQNQESNLVYVVSLASGTPEWSTIPWRDIVTQKRHYFHPFGSGGWPADPPNYLGFRYDGRLQSIHHVERYEIVTDLHSHIPEMVHPEPKSYILYSLGEPIRPSHTVKTGKIYPSGRVWAMIDLLLTCNTIAEARDRAKERLAQIADH